MPSLTVGNKYRFGGIDWTCVEEITNGYVLLSDGITAGFWPGYAMTGPSSGSGSWGSANTAYTNNIDGADISGYDFTTQVIYDAIKEAELESSYGSGLYLVGTSKTGLGTYSAASASEKIYRDTLANTAAESNKLFASGGAWLGNNSTSKAKAVSLSKTVGNSPQNSNFVLSLAFNLDIAKVEVSDSIISIPSAAGHNIKNQIGTEFERRSGLQFLDATVSDDSENDNTNIEVVKQCLKDELDELPDGLYQTTDEIEIADVNIIPRVVGSIIPFMGTKAPDGYLACDGTVYSISRYRKLADFFEDQFGSVNFFGGDGTSTFAVPDLRGEFLRGTGTNSHVLQGNGANVGIHQDATESPISRIVRNSSGTITQIYTSFPRYRFKSDAGQDYPAEGHYRLGKNFDSVLGASTISSSEVREDFDYNSSNKWNDGNLYDAGITSRPTNTSVLYCICYTDVVPKVDLTVEYTHDYSTTEKVVGTWIDGRPVYQIVFDGDPVNISSQSSAWYSLPEVPGISLILSAYAIMRANASSNKNKYFTYFNSKIDYGTSIPKIYQESPVSGESTAEQFILTYVKES